MPTAAQLSRYGLLPFGSQFFSDLTHYVRSGDFVLALIEESKDLNEYAFALGALAHYAADASGHELATNRAVCNHVSRAGKEIWSHCYLSGKAVRTHEGGIRLRCGQVAEGNYAPTAYHDFVGF